MNMVKMMAQMKIYRRKYNIFAHFTRKINLMMMIKRMKRIYAMLIK